MTCVTAGQTAVSCDVARRWTGDAHVVLGHPAKCGREGGDRGHLNLKLLWFLSSSCIIDLSSLAAAWQSLLWTGSMRL